MDNAEIRATQTDIPVLQKYACAATEHFENSRTNIETAQAAANKRSFSRERTKSVPE